MGFSKQKYWSRLLCLLPGDLPNPRIDPTFLKPPALIGRFFPLVLTGFWCCSVCQSTPWTAALQASLSFTVSWSLLKLMSIESVMPSNHPIVCHPLLLLPSIFPSTSVFSSELALCIRWPKYWSFSFSISSSNEYSGLISFGIGWFDLLAVQGTLQFHNFSLLYAPTLTSIHNYWKSHSFNYTWDLTWLQIRFLLPPHQVWFARVAHRTQGNTYLD